MWVFLGLNLFGIIFVFFFFLVFAAILPLILHLKSMISTIHVEKYRFLRIRFRLYIQYLDSDVKDTCQEIRVMTKVLT